MRWTDAFLTVRAYVFAGVGLLILIAYLASRR